MVKPFDQWKGIKKVMSGYIGGHVKNPTYEQVKTGKTGHYEAVQITYDENIISYEEIVHIFWKQVDSTDDGGQFHDRGDQYRSAIFYHTEKQRKIAEQTKQALEKSGKFPQPIVTKILAAKSFYPAETYHQDFYKTNPETYTKDRKKSGRDRFINKYWS